jgi:hypothetical protein
MYPYRIFDILSMETESPNKQTNVLNQRKEEKT